VRRSHKLFVWVTDTSGTRLRETASKGKALPKPGSDRATYKKAPRPFLISGPASPITPSWNQVVGFLTDWKGLRRLAA